MGRIGGSNSYRILLGHVCVCAQSISHVQLFVAPWTITCQAPLPMKFSRQEYQSGMPFPTPGDFPKPEIDPGSLVSPTLAGGSFITHSIWKAHHGHAHTAVFKIDTQQGSTLQHMELCLLLCGSPDGRAVWGENGSVYMCGWVPSCSPETVTTLFVNRLYPNTKESLRCFLKNHFIRL